MNSEKHTVMLNFRETPTTARRLEARAKRDRVPISKILRIALRLYLSGKAA